MAKYPYENSPQPMPKRAVYNRENKVHDSHINALIINVDEKCQLGQICSLYHFSIVFTFIAGTKKPLYK
ncbi:hypothetical protein AB733_21120 [Photobacterium swingsii]|uniref:Uncharacterized protein n=1 Tax=Photobacterium swingsii TaxID=680026 RepID=A0A0J8V5Y5_9GAMM|nr:hypothetical protein AB733_21120 [Photobacterium swingsii]PSW21645.1 hypothetical protein C9I94_21500 [Photobacterium swingsii]